MTSADDDYRPLDDAQRALLGRKLAEMNGFVCEAVGSEDVMMTLMITGSDRDGQDFTVMLGSQRIARIEIDPTQN